MGLLPYFISFIIVWKYYPPTGILNWILIIFAFLLLSFVLRYITNFISGLITLKFFKKSALKYGAIGGTARTIGKRYLQLKNASNKTNGEIIDNIIQERANMFGDLRLLKLIGNRKSLVSLIEGILSIETNYAENTILEKLEFIDVIYKELEILGLDDEETTR